MNGFSKVCTVCEIKKKKKKKRKGKDKKKKNTVTLEMFRQIRLQCSNWTFSFTGFMLIV